MRQVWLQWGPDQQVVVSFVAKPKVERKTH